MRMTAETRCCQYQRLFPPHLDSVLSDCYILKYSYMDEQWLRKKKPYFLHMKTLWRGNSSIFTQGKTRDKAISGPQAEHSILVDGIYILEKHKICPSSPFLLMQVNRMVTLKNKSATCRPMPFPNHLWLFFPLILLHYGRVR